MYTNIWQYTIRKQKNYRSGHRGQRPRNILDFCGTFWTKIYAILSDFFICRESRTLNSIFKYNFLSFISLRIGWKATEIKKMNMLKKFLSFLTLFLFILPCNLFSLYFLSPKKRRQLSNSLNEIYFLPPKLLFLKKVQKFGLKSLKLL